MTVTGCCTLSLSSRLTVYHLGKFGVVTLHYCKNDVHFSLDVNNYCLRATLFDFNYLDYLLQHAFTHVWACMISCYLDFP